MATATLRKEQVRFFSSESPAHQARLFEWNGGIYRAVSARQEPLVRKLRGEGILQELTDKGYIVPTSDADFTLEGYTTVLRHERVPFVTYPFEWPGAALREAALMFIDLNLELAAHGLATCDAHAWNILFRGSRPVFVDFGSLVPLAEANTGGVAREFERSFVYPLRLMQAGQHRIARCLMRDYANLLTDQEIDFLEGKAPVTRADRSPSLALRALRKARRELGRAVSLVRNGATPAAASWPDRLRALRETVAAIDPGVTSSKWSDYYDPATVGSDPAVIAKGERVAEAIRRLRPATVHDIAGNSGWFARLVAAEGCGVIVSDRDEVCLDRLFTDSRHDANPLTPVYLDLRNPSPSYGWTCGEYPKAADRLKADCAMALAIVHHLVFSQISDFREITATLSQFTRRSLIVEFISREDRFVSQWWKPEFEWYRIENFRAELSKRYRSVEVMPEHAPGRSLLVCDGFLG